MKADKAIKPINAIKPVKAIKAIVERSAQPGHKRRVRGQLANLWLG